MKLRKSALTLNVWWLAFFAVTSISIVNAEDVSAIYNVTRNAVAPSIESLSPYSSFESKVPLHCVSECTADTFRCNSVLYDSNDSQCQLFSSSQIGSDVTGSSGDVITPLMYFEKCDWPDCAWTINDESCCFPAVDDTACFDTDTVPLYTDCQDAFERGQRESGKMYYLRPSNSTMIIKAVCQFDTTSGWTVIQRRLDGSVDFYRYWEDYVRGFGSLEGEYWIGLDAIHDLTQTNRKLSIYLEAHDQEIRTANFSTWYIDGADTEYVMHVSGYDGDAGDSLNYHDNMAFSTQDNDNDDSSPNCAVKHSGAWWYNWCYHSNLNGLWFEGGFAADPKDNATAWQHWLGTTYSLKTVYMRLSRDP